MVRSSKKGTRSKTHPGRKNYTTKKGDKVSHRKGHNVKGRRKPYTKGARFGGITARDLKPSARITTPGYRPYSIPKGAASGGRIRSGYSPAVMPPARGMKAGGTIRLDHEIANLGKRIMSPQNRAMGKFFKDVGRAVARTDNYKRRMGK